MSIKCARRGCEQSSFIYYARQHYCVRHYRVWQMVGSSNTRYGTKISMNLVDQLLNNFIRQHDMCCPTCHVNMVWITQQGQRNQVITIQHWTKDKIGFLCYRCNIRHSQGTLHVPKNKRRCTLCKQVLSTEKFGKDTSRNDGLSYRCQVCARVYNRQSRQIYAQQQHTTDTKIKRTCWYCRVSKPLKEFRKDRTRKHGRSYICGGCKKRQS